MTASNPRIGEHLWLDDSEHFPVTVIAVWRTITFYVQGHVSIGSTRQPLFDRED